MPKDKGYPKPAGRKVRGEFKHTGEQPNQSNKPARQPNPSVYRGRKEHITTGPKP